VVKEVDTSDELEAEKAFKAFEVNIHAGSTVRIIGQQVGLSRLQARVRYSLTIPERYDLDLRTGGGGAITISDRVGRVAAVTNSGSISIEAAEGEVEAEAGGGAASASSRLGGRSTSKPTRVRSGWASLRVLWRRRLEEGVGSLSRAPLVVCGSPATRAASRSVSPAAISRRKPGAAAGLPFVDR
jgi:hypothetical protein